MKKRASKQASESSTTILKAKPRPARLIKRIQAPANHEASSIASSQFTPNAGFFVRNHFPVPPVSRSKWRLQVDGLVGKVLSLSIGDLESMPSVAQTAVLECAGNGRMFLPNVPEGIQWGMGAVGCASWTGVPLRDVLKMAEVKADAVEVVLEGADHGVPEKHFKPKDEIHFSRSLSLAVAQRPEVLLAYRMNGERLSPAHGAPLRLIVPGWYGVAAVKWLTRIKAVSTPFHGYFQTVEYAYWKSDSENAPQREPITEMLTKSQISRPSTHERLASGSEHQIRGIAWTGGSQIVRVEVSADGGQTWSPAELGEQSSEYAWRTWQFDWLPDSPGNYTLMSRATDALGNMQPAEHDENHESYMIHHTLPVSVVVTKSPKGVC